MSGQDRYAGLLAAAASLTSEELLDVVEDAQREIDAAHARQAVALAHLSATEPVRQEDGTTVEVHRGLGHQRLDAPELAASRLGVSVHVATTRVEDAVRQLTRTPALVDAMAAGVLDLRRAAVVTDETEFLDAGDAAAVVDALAPHWAGVTVGPLRRLAARTVARFFPGSVAAEADRVRARRALTRVTGEHGVDTWRGDVLVEQSRPAWAAVTELARRLVREGVADSLAQARSDAMMRLILEHSDVRVVVHTTRAADTADAQPEQAAGLRGNPAARPRAANEDWVEVGGFGAPGTAFVPADAVGPANGPADGRIRPHARSGLVCDRGTGALVGGHVPAGLAPGRDLTRTAPIALTDDSGAPACTTYRIPAAMVRFVRLRDGSCRFPGCSTPARQCDLDHVRPWPTGPTSTTNLICLCRRHHRIKQRDGWTLRLHPDATITWTDPTGRTSNTTRSTTSTSQPPPLHTRRRPSTSARIRVRPCRDGTSTSASSTRTSPSSSPTTTPERPDTGATDQAPAGTSPSTHTSPARHR
ncbi:hypothetical protein N798_03195 [Knoellia flava TL1]|uniref:HNH nuclease domain-containing protein n=2 Tax=Knoellia flava TaxID=913969 RepID=A0A8H9FU64_9MICO|nr:hypothetical protein N798_03195 [Knoellia flava TL1]GGB78225.1 hypothetical protein GCM10011314_17370 [Knoellia flava]